MKRWAFLALLPALATSASAEPSDGADDALEAARQRYPATDVRSAQPTPLPGVYEFDMGGETVYGDATARHLILGRMLDMEAEAPAAVDYRAVAGAAFALQQGPLGEFVLFSDPQCPYCAEFERRLVGGELAGYSIRVVLVPLSGRMSEEAGHILCAAAPGAAYRAWVLDRARPAPCAGADASGHRAAARLAGVSATPTFLAPNGATLAGLPAPADLLAWVEAGQAR